MDTPHQSSDRSHLITLCLAQRRPSVTIRDAQTQNPPRVEAGESGARDHLRRNGRMRLFLARVRPMAQRIPSPQ